MNIQNCNNISFKKRLKANCAIIHQDEVMPCSIYQLDENDIFYFEDLIFKRDWQKSRFIIKADDAVKDLGNNDVFVLEENEKNKCLGFCIIGDDGKTKNLKYIETIPKMRAKNPKRKSKYIGEALIAFLMKTSKKGQNFHIKHVLKEAIPFYENCGFKQTKRKNCAFIINPTQKTDIISQYEQHIGNTLTVVA